MSGTDLDIIGLCRQIFKLLPREATNDVGVLSQNGLWDFGEKQDSFARFLGQTRLQRC